MRTYLGGLEPPARAAISTRQVSHLQGGREGGREEGGSLGGREGDCHDLGETGGGLGRGKVYSI